MVEKIGIIGGTGLEGTGLALRFGDAGFSVAIGSRSPQRAQEKAEQLNRRIGTRVCTPGENTEVVAGSELIFLTTPFEHAAATIKMCLPHFRQDSVLVDVTVPVVVGAGKVELLNFAEGSGTQHLAGYIPRGVALVAAFKTIPAEVLADLDVPLDCDVFVCGNSEEAKQRVMQAVTTLKSARPVDAGPMERARALEHMCALAIGINRRYKVKCARFRVVGLSSFEETG